MLAARFIDASWSTSWKSTRPAPMRASTPMSASDTIEVDKVRMRSVSPEGLVTRSTANRGLSNSDGSELQLQLLHRWRCRPPWLPAHRFGPSLAV